MASEKNNSKVAKKEKKGLIQYLIGVRQEFSKVVWPARSELLSSTGVVFAVCAFFAVVFWAVDTGFLALLQRVLGITLS